MRVTLALCLLCLSLCSSALAQIGPPPRGQWVVDTTGKVSASTVAELNRVAAEFDASGAGQLGVLVTDSTGGVAPRTFATGVFNDWGIGHAASKDGVLLFFALSDRKSEIVLGTGSPVKGNATDVVMQNDLVPNMKRGDLSAALLQSAQSLVRMFRESRAVEAVTGPNVPVVPERDDPLLPYSTGQKSFTDYTPRTWVIDLTGQLAKSERAQLDVAASGVYALQKGRVIFLIVNTSQSSTTLNELVARLWRQVGSLSKTPTAIIGVDSHGPHGRVWLPPHLIHDQWEDLQVIKQENELTQALAVNDFSGLLRAETFVHQALVNGIPPKPTELVLQEAFDVFKWPLFMIGAVVMVLALWLLRRWNRKRTRYCKECSRPRQLLGEAEDDAHLTSGQKSEERVASVDYDVWWCGRCNDALVLRYGSWGIGFSKCPKCRAKTRSSSTTTLQRATEYSGGIERVNEQCAHCNYTRQYDRTTARLSSSSSSTSSFGSSSRSSFSSSSSSSRSSFGGGSSSGGGSSGSW